MIKFFFLTLLFSSTSFATDDQQPPKPQKRKCPWPDEGSPAAKLPLIIDENGNFIRVPVAQNQ